jgi:hypothetical protein
MKVHFGVDMGSGAVYTVEITAANEAGHQRLAQATAGRR